MLKVDICCGLAWGDEAKGKIVAKLAKSGHYDFVCRWAGGNNAGHTVFIKDKKYFTHLIPSGIFYGIKSIIGPNCVLNLKWFYEELKYLEENGFDISLIKVSPKTHIVLDRHIKEDEETLYKQQGTTARGIAPCYSDKYKRCGLRAGDVSELKEYLWDEKLYGNILCEGAQGFWLDTNYGNYPYVTSSHTLPYDACSLGFPPQCINKIYGAAKIYDTRSGVDPEFPEELLKDTELLSIADAGKEYGVTTGRRRKVNWLNLDKLIEAIQISGVTDLVISKVDILQEVNLYKFIYQNSLHICVDLATMMDEIVNIIEERCCFVCNIVFSNNPETF